MKQTVVEPTVADVLGEVLDAADDGVLAVAPDPETIEGLVRVLGEDAPSVRLLADVGALKAATNDFLVAGRAANHVEDGVLEIRRYDEGTNALLVSESSVTAVVRGDDHAAGLTTDDGTFVADASGRFADAWADAEAYDLRTPPLAEVHETLEAELGESTAGDFDAVLSALESAPTRSRCRCSWRRGTATSSTTSRDGARTSASRRRPRSPGRRRGWRSRASSRRRRFRSTSGGRASGCGSATSVSTSTTTASSRALPARCLRAEASPVGRLRFDARGSLGVVRHRNGASYNCECDPTSTAFIAPRPDVSGMHSKSHPGPTIGDPA